MAFAHSRYSRVLADGVSLSGWLSQWEHTHEVEMADVSVHTDAGHRWIPGLHNGTLGLSGRFDADATAGGQDATMAAARGAQDAGVVTAAPAGTEVGARVVSIEAREASYSVVAPVAEAVTWQASWQAEGRVDVGVSLHDLAAETATGQGSGVDNTGSTPDGGVGVLHVTEAAGTSPTLDVVVQHSPDGSTWADLVTLAQMSAAGAQRVPVTGTVDRHVRAIWTVGGTNPQFSFMAAFCRR